MIYSPVICESRLKTVLKEYSIELAKQEHIAMLPIIERAAAEIFPANMVSEEVKSSVASIEELAEAQGEQRLWVAIAPDGRPVGFAMGSIIGNSAMLAEIDVHPEHQQKGLGRALVQTVITWARNEGFTHLSLTTFHSVPWNAAFYEQMGFRSLTYNELTADLAAILKNEEQLGLKERVAMQIDFTLRIKMEEKLIAPCGMNCGLCVSYLAMKHDLNKKGFSKRYCPGCRPRGKNCTFMKKSCDLLGKGLVQFCFLCANYPCKRLRDLDHRYNSRYHMSMLENLRFIKDNGMDSFLEKEKTKWCCPECGATICCHNGLCLNCNLHILRQNKKYCWG